MGLKHGNGLLQFPNGETFEGSFENDYKQGFGKLVYPSGNFYEGEWFMN